MRRFWIAILMALAFCVLRDESGAAPAALKPVDEAAQIQLLAAKLEELEKRISDLEVENQKLQENLHRLTMFTELGIHFDVERAMMIPLPNAVLR